jgi:hypothetical protein
MDGQIKLRPPCSEIFPFEYQDLIQDPKPEFDRNIV